MLSRLSFRVCQRKSGTWHEAPQLGMLSESKWQDDADAINCFICLLSFVILHWYQALHAKSSSVSSSESTTAACLDHLLRLDIIYLFSCRCGFIFCSSCCATHGELRYARLCNPCFLGGFWFIRLFIHLLGGGRMKMMQKCYMLLPFCFLPVCC